MTDMLSTLASGFGDKALMLVDKDGTPAGHIFGTEIVGAMERAKPHSDELPAGFIELAYLESDGNSYLDTNIKGNVVDRVAGKVSFTTFGNKTIYVVGGKASSEPSSNAIGYAVYSSAHGGFCYYPASWRDSSSVEIAANQIVTFDTFIGTSSQTFEVDGIQKDSATVTAPRDSSSRTVFLFALHTSTSYQYCGSGTRIYDAQMYYSGNKIADYTPAMRSSNGEVGMFDLVSRRFLTNAGTGTFSYGEL